MIQSVILLLAALIGCSLAHESPAQQPKTTYGVIVDCGSSGTRAHLFEWDSDLDYPELLNDIEPMRDQDGKPITKKITPGLSSIQDDPDRSSDYMKPLIDFIINQIPERSHDSTAIYIMGTAGMRMLEHQTQLKIMNDIVADLKARFKFAQVSASVISGSQEGMYEWITVNSKLKRFSSSGRENKAEAIIEMGGSSVQIAFNLDKDLRRFIEGLLAKEPHSVDAFRSQLVRPEYHKKRGEDMPELLSVSFLGLGGNSAREAHVDLLIHLSLESKSFKTRFGKRRVKVEVPSVLKDPCLPKDAVDTLKKPVRMLKSQDQTIGFNLEPDDETFEIRLVGAGNHAICQRLLKEMLVRAKRERLNCEPDKPCTMSLIGTPFVPFGLFHIYGLSEFYYTTSNMIDLAGTYDRDLILKRTKKICATSYSRLLLLYPNADRVDPQRVREECFKATWIDTFLVDGLGMPIRFERFETVGKIKGDDIDWTLGAVLDKSFAIENAVEKLEEN